MFSNVLEKGHAATNRVMLYEKGGVRYAKLLKSPNRAKMEVRFQITEDGVRDVEDDMQHGGEDQQQQEEEDN